MIKSAIAVIYFGGKMRNRLIIGVLCAILAIGAVGCSNSGEPVGSAIPTPTPTTSEAVAPTEQPTEENRTVSVISRNFDAQTLSRIEEGAKAGAQDANIELEFVGYSDDEVEQATMLATEFNDGVGAVALCAESSPTIIDVLEQMTNDTSKEYPLVLYGGDITDAPEGSVNARVFDGQREAGELSADHLLENEDVLKDMQDSNSTSTSVITVVAMSDNDVLEIERINAFIDRIIEICAPTHPDTVSVLSSSMVYKRDPVANATMKVFVEVLPADANDETMNSTIQALLKTNNLSGIFVAGEMPLSHILTATDGGEDLRVPVVTYGSDQVTMSAIESGFIEGACYADPYEVGYQLAIQAAKAIENPTAQLDNITVPVIWETKQ